MFVPVSSQASPAAMELALRITNTIREFQAGRSDVTPRDVRHALRMAELSTGPIYPRAAILALLAAILASGLLLALVIQKRPESAGPSATAIPFAILMAVLGVFLVFFVLRRR